MKIKPEKLDNDIIELLVEQQILMHKTKLEQLFNKEFKFEEIINVDRTIVSSSSIKGFKCEQ